MGEITGNEEILLRYVKTLRPSRDELEASLKAQLTLQDLLVDPKAVRHEGGCILWPTKAQDLRSIVKVDGVGMVFDKSVKRGRGLREFLSGFSPTS